MPEFTDYKTLRDTAKEIQNLLQTYAPIDTGNLRNKIRTANSINKIIQKTPQKGNNLKYSIGGEFVIDYAPAGASYGKWFNDPPEVVSKQRKALEKTAKSKGNWNYAERAINEAIQKNIDKIANELANAIANTLADDIDTL